MVGLKFSPGVSCSRAALMEILFYLSPTSETFHFLAHKSNNNSVNGLKMIVPPSTASFLLFQVTCGTCR